MGIKNTLQKRAGGLLAHYTPYGLYRVLSRELAQCVSVVDCGCGTDSIMQHLCNRRSVVGVDRYLPSLTENRARGRYAEHVQGDILSAPLQSLSMDAAVSLDVIEHFSKEDGLRMLDTMERVARKRVIVMTPNGFVPQAADHNPWQEHRSGWTVEEFQARGYDVFGIYGAKELRGEYARLNRRPWLFWEIASFLSQRRVARDPGRAYLICAVLRKDA